MKDNAPSYHGYRFPPEIISHAIWLYHRFCLSFRDVEDLLAERGILVSYETIRQWCRKFGPEYARRLERRQGRLGDTWHSAERFFRKLLKGQGHEPRRLVTDKLRSYAAAHRTIMPSVSHEPTRQRERQMRRFKSSAQAQRFLSVHGITQNLFRVGRHLLRAVNQRMLRARAFLVWNAITCA